MRPLRECTDEQLAALTGVLTDIDDTLTTSGRLTAEAYGAMQMLRAAGVRVVPVTGRPAGWCDHIARMWPVDAVVGENGAFWFRYDHAERRMHRHFVSPREVRTEQRAKLTDIAARVLKAVPDARVAADQLYREADLAIDFCEDIPRLPETDVDRIVGIMTEAGLTVKVSSIHVNGWFGTHDKLSTSIDLLAGELGYPANVLAARFAFLGDSPNDQPMFEYFRLSVGVANVRAFAERITTLPAYVTEQSSGAGFAEFTQRLCAAKARLTNIK
jgi:HAD superfamily hydrolase (TIGR01484 family)